MFRCAYCWRVYLTPWHLWRRITGRCPVMRGSDG